jgi:chromosome segregation ATPase
MSSTRITGAILVLLLISILAFEVSGMGISAYFLNNGVSISYFSMLLETVAIVVIVVVLMVSLFSLFTTTSSSKKSRKLAQKVVTDLTEKHSEAKQVMLKMHEHEKSVSGLTGKLHQRLKVLDQMHNVAEQRSEKLEKTTDRLQSHERDLQLATDSIGTRLEQVQTYWDDQLEETVDTVQRIRTRLGSSLSHVDNSMGRLKEQEAIAQQLTGKLLKSYEVQATAQKENNAISTQVRKSLDATLSESNQLLQHLQSYHHNAKQTFNNFSNKMEEYENRSYEHFEDIFGSADRANEELQANLKQSQTVMTQLNSYDQNVKALSEKVSSQLENLEMDRVSIVTKTLKETSELCHDLKQGMSETQSVLYGLKSLNKDDKTASQQLTEQTLSNQSSDINTKDDYQVSLDSLEPPNQNQCATEANSKKNTEEKNLVSFFARR